MRSEPGSALLRLAGLLCLLVAAVVGLGWMGTGPLGVPSILEPGAWSAWAGSRDAVTIAFALLRLGTLLVAWYLLGVTVIGIVARLVRNVRMVRFADALTVPAVRQVLQSALGAGLATAALTAGSAGVTTAPAAPPVAAASLPATDQVAMTPVLEERVAMTPLEPARAADPPGAPDQPGPRERHWTVEPGDHFWSIAERVLGEALGRNPSDGETTAYWERLVAANRNQLVDPGNPDFIVPGQTFRVPPP